MTAYIPLEEMIGNLQVDLGFSAPALKPILSRWVYEALDQVGGNRIFEAKVKLEIHNLKITKPSNLLAAKSIFLTKLGSPETCVEPIYDRTVRCCKNTGNSDETVYVSETTESFCFSDTADAYTHVYLHYYTPPVVDGEIMIPYIAREAIYAYVDYKFLKRARRQYLTSASRQNPVNLTDLKETQKEWKIRAAEARGRINSPDNVRQLKEIGNKIMFETPNTYPQQLRSLQKGAYEAYGYA